MRFDTAGLFWDDTPPPKEVKEDVKREPPPRTWEAPDYLPGLAEAQAMELPFMSDSELVEAAIRKYDIIYDLEVYPNYFVCGYKCEQTGKFGYVESFNDSEYDRRKLAWIANNFRLIGFNIVEFDSVILTCSIAGWSNEDLSRATQDLILYGVRPYEFLKTHKVKKIKFNHVDLINIAPLSASLKIYGGRIHTKRMQDLPFPPGTVLTREQADIVRWYCLNGDLNITHDLYRELKEQVDLREQITKEIGVDVRSTSDPQLAEAIVGAELRKMGRTKIPKAEVQPGRVYRYAPPPYIRFRTPLLNRTLAAIAEAPFVVDEGGAIASPPALENMKIVVGSGTYTLGIGGLHSNEKCAAHFQDAEYILRDFDVASYYPKLILNAGMYPEHIGPDFLTVFARIVSRRLAAKAAGEKIVAETLKIAANGTFGKLFNMWAIVYAPNLGIQVTVTGQLSLLMLVEALELVGISVISANTDGIIVKCPRARAAEVDAIVAEWAVQTRLEMEETRYSAVYSRDVNSYLAVKLKQDKKTGAWLDEFGGTKFKGGYAHPWLELERGDGKASVMRFHVNPTAQICVDALEAWLVKGVAPEETIAKCKDITRFISVRSVKGGAVDLNGNVYLGKAVRWYYAKNVSTFFVYANSGNKVPKTDGAKPAMVLPDAFPEDVDLSWYAQEARKMLTNFYVAEDA